MVVPAQLDTTPVRRMYNPVQKDAAIFVQTAAESGGVRTLLDLEVAPGGGNMLHYHTTFDEQFTVMSGEFGVQVGNEHFTLKPGDSAVAPAMALHRWYNTSAETAIVRVELLPGNTGFERTLQISYGLAQDGLLNKQGLPKNIAHLSILIELSDTIVPGVFARILPIMRLIARYARRKGIEQQLIERYCR
jgi:quercetin dioxygenase-like cupin family protein